MVMPLVKVLVPLKVLLLDNDALVAKFVVIVVAKFGSLPKAVASSFNVSRVVGAELINEATLVST